MAALTTTILLAEDDVDLQITTKLVLEQHGYDVVVAGDGEEALAMIATTAPDLVLADVMMPRMDGITLTRRIRASSDIPVIMLTARDLTHDQVMGLEAGADDYITKPFDGDVLDARIKAVLRRGAAKPTTDTVRLGDVELDFTQLVAERAGEPVDLSATEFRILEALLRHPGAVLSRRQLLEQVWGSADWSEERIVDVNVHRLRTKLGSDVIRTVRGAGYRVVR